MNQICGSKKLLQPSPKTPTKTPLKPVPSKKPTQKQAAPEQVSELVEEYDEPMKKKGRKNMTLAERYEHFLQKSVVWGKAVKVSYVQEQGLGVLSKKLEAQ